MTKYHRVCVCVGSLLHIWVNVSLQKLHSANVNVIGKQRKWCETCKPRRQPGWKTNKPINVTSLQKQHNRLCAVSWGDSNHTVAYTSNLLQAKSLVTTPSFIHSFTFPGNQQQRMHAAFFHNFVTIFIPQKYDVLFDNSAAVESLSKLPCWSQWFRAVTIVILWLKQAGRKKLALLFCVATGQFHVSDQIYTSLIKKTAFMAGITHEPYFLFFFTDD